MNIKDQDYLKWPHDMRAKDDFKWCEKVIKSHSGSFYRAFKHLRKDKALAVFAIYAFCRIADDAVDEHNDATEINLLEQKLTDFSRGINFDEPLWRALRLTFDRFDLTFKPYFDLVHGLKMDLEHVQPADMAAFDNYCYFVAGTVGLMLCPLMAKDPENKKIENICVKLGHAMQITNILRDVGTDHRLGRIYLPANMMQEAGIDSTHLAEPLMSKNLIALWEKLAAIAEEYYLEVEKNIDFFDKKAKLPLLLSLEYYRSIIHECRKSDYMLLQRRIFVPNWKKLLIFWKIKFKTILG